MSQHHEYSARAGVCGCAGVAEHSHSDCVLQSGLMARREVLVVVELQTQPHSPLVIVLSALSCRVVITDALQQQHIATSAGLGQGLSAHSSANPQLLAHMIREQSKLLQNTGWYPNGQPLFASSAAHSAGMASQMTPTSFSAAPSTSTEPSTAAQLAAQMGLTTRAPSASTTSTATRVSDGGAGSNSGRGALKNNNATDSCAGPTPRKMAPPDTPAGVVGGRRGGRAPQGVRRLGKYTIARGAKVDIDVVDEMPIFAAASVTAFKYHPDANDRAAPALTRSVSDVGAGGSNKRAAASAAATTKSSKQQKQQQLPKKTQVGLSRSKSSPMGSASSTKKSKSTPSPVAKSSRSPSVAGRSASTSKSHSKGSGSNTTPRSVARSDSEDDSPHIRGRAPEPELGYGKFGDELVGKRLLVFMPDPDAQNEDSCWRLAEVVRYNPRNHTHHFRVQGMKDLQTKELHMSNCSTMLGRLSPDSGDDAPDGVFDIIAEPFINLEHDPNETVKVHLAGPMVRHLHSRIKLRLKQRAVRQDSNGRRVEFWGLRHIHGPDFTMGGVGDEGSVSMQDDTRRKTAAELDGRLWIDAADTESLDGENVNGTSSPVSPWDSPRKPAASASDGNDPEQQGQPTSPAAHSPSPSADADDRQGQGGVHRQRPATKSKLARMASAAGLSHAELVAMMGRRRSPRMPRGTEPDGNDAEHVPGVAHHEHSGGGRRTKLPLRNSGRSASISAHSGGPGGSNQGSKSDASDGLSPEGSAEPTAASGINMSPEELRVYAQEVGLPVSTLVQMMQGRSLPKRSSRPTTLKEPSMRPQSARRGRTRPAQSSGTWLEGQSASTDVKLEAANGSASHPARISRSADSHASPPPPQVRTQQDEILADNSGADSGRYSAGWSAERRAQRILNRLIDSPSFTGGRARKRGSSQHSDGSDDAMTGSRRKSRSPYSRQSHDRSRSDSAPRGEVSKSNGGPVTPVRQPGGLRASPGSNAGSKGSGSQGRRQRRESEHRLQANDDVAQVLQQADEVESGDGEEEEKGDGIDSSDEDTIGLKQFLESTGRRSVSKHIRRLARTLGMTVEQTMEIMPRRQLPAREAKPAAARQGKSATSDAESVSTSAATPRQPKRKRSTGAGRMSSPEPASGNDSQGRATQKRSSDVAAASESGRASSKQRRKGPKAAVLQRSGTGSAAPNPDPGAGQTFIVDRILSRRSRNGVRGF